ncbi:MAG: hypothetical protein WKF58_08165 [Ilumatobacteraceae bacterium]
MAEATDRPGLTPSQTVGPFLHLALDVPGDRVAVEPGSDGSIVVRGRVTDGNGDPVPDGLVETWQIDGRFARCATDARGEWVVHTAKPPAAPARRNPPGAAPVRVGVREGLLDRVVTRCYFDDEADANDVDPTLAAIVEDRRHTLVAGGSAVDGYRFDIRLQGDDETVFFDI